MPLSPGARLGPYEIQAAIGAGGMGEVYRARDTRLDRTVAIKILPAELSADPERRVRFEREAKAIAGLNHPHICTLYDVSTHEDTTFLVMEHLAGETLADRLLRGPVPHPQALDIAAQIADALDAAHKHGIIHRDLKPGNVMLTTSGGGRSGLTTAKLLDFGLAKLAAHGERAALAGGASVSTQAAPVTAEGTILGTLQYMAPEQLEGKEADARTDLWALGAILYEMLTGRRAFEGESQVSLIGNIMNAEPPALATTQPLTPPALDRVVTKCLAKHPGRSLGHRARRGRRAAVDFADKRHGRADGRPASAPAGPVDVPGGRGHSGWRDDWCGRDVDAAPDGIRRAARPSERGREPGRGTERRGNIVFLDSYTRRLPDGADMDSGRTGAGLCGPAERRTTALRPPARCR